MQGHINTCLSLASILPITPDGQMALGAHSPHFAHPADELHSLHRSDDIPQLSHCWVSIPCLFFPIPKLPSPPECCKDSIFLISTPSNYTTPATFCALTQTKEEDFSNN